jgi:hypothetical protein
MKKAEKVRIYQESTINICNNYQCPQVHTKRASELKGTERSRYCTSTLSQQPTLINAQYAYIKLTMIS